MVGAMSQARPEPLRTYGSDASLYEQEDQKAFNLIKQLESILAP